MSKLIDRVQRILVSPKTEWPVIAAEPETTAGLYKNYIAILAAIGPVAMFVKSSLIGFSVPFIGSFRVGIGEGIAALVVSYGLTLASVYVLALIINGLAPTFAAAKDPLQALKTAAYGLTAAWIAGVGQLLPMIGWLIGLAGFAYSVYIIYLGLPVTMKTPQDKSAGYTAVSVIAAFVLGWIVMAIAHSIVGRGLWGGFGVTGPTISRSGGFEEGSAGKALEEWSKRVEAAGKAVEESAEQQDGVPSGEAIGQLIGAVTGGGKGGGALPIDRIKAYLPATLAGLPRTSASAERNGAVGLQISEARADYSDGAGRDLHLEITDTGGAQGFVALAAWANVEQERDWEGGYERDYRSGGRMIHERWDGSSGEYGVIVGKRFMVEVSGRASNIDELKAALATGVDLSALEAVAASGGSG